MRERPILFSAPMVRALLDGTKTQTRRVCKPAEAAGLSFVVEVPDPLERGQVYNGSHFGDEEGGVQFASPYGGVGDRLWVREAIRLVPDQEPDDGTGRVLSAYGADGSLTVADAWPWKRSYLPPMHCPRGLSRIDLEITGVRVERLQDISEADAQAEGTPCYVCGRSMDGLGEDDCHCFHAKAKASDYRNLWEAINGPGSWDANPWVWVVEFRRIKP